ncbi:hypothetical protein DXG01_002961 [Tephrocybe rancida]|nr:hypothetical protein DXG01_002961 [Tephrocybe rancida]
MHRGGFHGGARGRSGSCASPDPRAHPWLSQDRDTQDIILAMLGKDRESIPVHQMKGYIAFNRAIRDSSEKAACCLIVPLGYCRFSTTVNKANVVSTGYLDPCYHDLLVLGLLTSKGEVDTQVLQDINSALRRPHGEQVKQTMFYHLHQEEHLLSALYSDNDNGISDYLSDGDEQCHSASPVRCNCRGKSTYSTHYSKAHTPRNVSATQSGMAGPSNTTHTPAPTPIIAHAPVMAPAVPDTIAPGSAATTADPEIDPRDVDTLMGPINSNLGKLQDYNDEE